MNTRLVFSIILVCSCCCAPLRAAVEIERSDSAVTVTADAYTIQYNLEKGIWDARWHDGRPLLKNAYGTWALKLPGGGSRVVPTAGTARRKVDISEESGPLGDAKTLTVSFPHPKMDLAVTTKFTFHETDPFFVVDQRLENTGREEYRVSKASPVEAGAGRGGGFFPGADPAMVRVLENGFDLFFDFFVRVVDAVAPVKANWNAAYFDRATGRTAVAGFISTDRAFVSVRSHYNTGKSIEMDGWKALSSLNAEASYDPAPPLRPGETFEAERLYFGLGAGPLPHPALELFADAVARNYGLEPWQGDVPTGWNAWATKYHHDLTRENMLENARRAAKTLLPYGMTTFQIDDGYQQEYGDWFADENFPGGMGDVAARIAELGFTPGIWSQPFCVSTHSRLAAEHPDWIAPKDKRGEMMMPKDWLILDPTHPEVQQWLRDSYRRYSREWGYKFLKIDFIYFVQLAARYHDPDATAVEAYRRGVEAIREGAGDDAFIMAVGVPAANSAGLADGLRLGLDITPEWQDDEGYAAQGVKPMVRNFARRYYLNNRVWINHPDMFYLGSPEEEKRWDGHRLTLEEARTYATLASIEGGIVKIGDSFVGLNDVQIDLLRRLLPVYRGTARPIDLFERLYPEIWHLPVKTGALDYDVITLFNWGRNRRWGEVVEEKEREIRADLGHIGTDPGTSYIVTESWSGDYLGEARGELAVTMPPRTVKVFALRPVLDRPQFIYTNRHVTQGATDIESISWNPDIMTLSGTQQVVPGFEYVLKFRVPAGFEPESATFAGSDIAFKWNSPVLEIGFSSDSSSPQEWQVVFSGG